MVSPLDLVELTPPGHGAGRACINVSLVSMSNPLNPAEVMDLVELTPPAMMLIPCL
jgi:hypothetical protein